MLNRLKSLLSPPPSRPVDESIAYKKQGDEHLKLDRLADAVTCYRRAVSMNPAYADACVGLGFALSEQKEYREAEQYLRQALSIDPGIADAHYILGTISKRQNDRVGSIDHFTRTLEVKPDFEFAYRDLFSAFLEGGEIQKARDIMDRAISTLPESAEFRFNLGNLLSREGEYDNAVACYQKALSIQPGSPELHKSLADALSKRGHLDQAVASYQKALWFEPNFVDAHSGLGRVMQSQGKLDLAIGCYRRAVALDPEIVAAHQNLGNALLERGETQDAIACYEQVVRLDPENGVKHLIAALSGLDSERAPSGYVEQLFDQYAQKFDSHLVEVLGYSDPEKLADLLRPYSEPNGEKWVILDLGCGTGLSGAAIASYSKQLVGVDLSAKMLEKAANRKLYDRLEHRDLLTMMQGEAASSYDVVFATDVFIYVGKLDDLMIHVQRLLRPGGLFAFSVESLDALMDDVAAPPERHDYRLNVTGRYAHSIAYLARMAAHNGFEVLRVTDTQNRLDKGKPVHGYLAVWRRGHV
jgi:predicted TPR repeat methyltransferase